MTPHVIIVGGGFGGLYAAKELRKEAVRVTLIDRRNHHIFQPLLYQVATAALNPSDIAQPIRAVLRSQKNCEVVLADVTGVDLAERKVTLSDEQHFNYDYLILATGATHSYFGHEAWSASAPGLKTLEDAVEIRRRVLSSFEAAEREVPEHVRRALLTFVVVGGGPTGVELAGALAELSHCALARDFRHIDPTQARVVLLEAGPRILPTYPADMSARALTQLKELGVEVWLGSPVTAIDPQGVDLGEKRIDARTVIWGAGVKASAIGATLGVPLNRDGRVKVTSQLTLPDHRNVFIVGDLAAAESDGHPVPGVAAAAIQMGRHAAQDIGRALRGNPPRVFHYHDRGSLATIGRSRAVALFPSQFRLYGFSAWLAWLLIHVLLLIGFRNRTMVVLQWAWAYFTNQRGARLITGAPAHAEIAVSAPPEQGATFLTTVNQAPVTRDSVALATADDDGMLPPLTKPVANV